MRSPRPDPSAIAGAAPAPIPQPVSAAENPLPVRRDDSPAKAADTPAEAEGRRTLSAAFVRVGPDGRLTVERRDGRADDGDGGHGRDSVRADGESNGCGLRAADSDPGILAPGPERHWQG